jgi:hypothetical protein
MGGRALLFSGQVVLSALIFTVDDGDTPPPPFIIDGHHPERPPRRAAQPISSADSGGRSVAARWLWAMPGLSSGRFVVAATSITLCIGGMMEIPNQSTGGVF